MNMLSNERVMPESLGFWIREEAAPVQGNKEKMSDSMEESIFLCEEDISDEELMAMILGQRNI